jgi:hypothetical protein
MKPKLAVLLVFFAAISTSLRAQQVLSISPAGVTQASIDSNSWRNFKVTLTQNITAFQFVGVPPPAQGTVTVIFKQNATGGFTVTFAPWTANGNTPRHTRQRENQCLRRKMEEYLGHTPRLHFHSGLGRSNTNAAGK